jgi:hypothetical protein
MGEPAIRALGYVTVAMFQVVGWMGDFLQLAAGPVGTVVDWLARTVH